MLQRNLARLRAHASDVPAARSNDLQVVLTAAEYALNTHDVASLAQDTTVAAGARLVAACH